MTTRIKRETFLKLLSKHLYPTLRAEGFRGSGETLRRISRPVVHIFNFQGSTGAETCYLNLGCHYDFLPDVASMQPELESMRHASCHLHFRTRITPADQCGDWAYGTSEAEAVETIHRIAEEWPRQAPAFFKRFDYPDGLLKIIADAPLTRPPGELLTLARAAAHFKQKERARELANAALKEANSPEGIFAERVKALLQPLD
jgi:hypothetical protein